MAKISFGSINLTAGQPASLETPADAPFLILLLGDFSGRASRGVCQPNLAARKPVRVDRDNFDQLPGKLGTALHLPVAGGATLAFTEIDDFHPDRIVQRFEGFQALRDLRKRLADRATFPAAIGEVRAWAKPEKPEAPPASPSPPLAPENLLEQMLGESHERAALPAEMPGGEGWSRFLQQVVGPHLISAADDATQAQLIETVDRATGGLMRAVLHYPEFQNLEAAWRGAQLLVRRLDTDGPLRLHLLDVSKAELAADLTSAEDLEKTGIYRLLVEQTVKSPGGKPWALVVGLYTFDRSPEDTAVLGRLARIAGPGGAPFLAAAHPRVFGCDSLPARPEADDWRVPVDEAWPALRELPEAAWLGLTAPRWLARLPYGKESDAIEQFEFEEVPPGGRHEDYLWANPAAVCACLLGQSFHRAGWSLRPGAIAEIDNLPYHIYEEDGAKRMKPCAEAWLGERAAEKLAEQGVMALLSVQGSPAVRLHRMQSLADPPRPLAGRWQ